MECHYDNPEAVLDEFRRAGALLEGHFILSSGRRSPVFLQKALVFSDPVATEKLCRALAEKLRQAHERIDVVCGPAIGALIPAYETARALGCRFVFTERDRGRMTLKRNFDVAPDEKIIILEDHITTGLSLRETIEALRHYKPAPDIIGAACIIDRSGGRADTGDIPLTALAQVDFPDYAPDEIPPELATIPPVKPGSREFTQ